MWRTLFIVSTLGFLLSSYTALLMGVARLWKLHQTSQAVDDVLKKLLRALDREDIKIRYARSYWVASAKVDPTCLILPIGYEKNRHAACIGHALLRLGLMFYHKKHGAHVEWRLKSLKLGYLLPIFVIMAAVFSSLIGKLPIMICLCAISISLLVASAALWLSMSVEVEAARLMVSLTKKHRLLVKGDDEDEVLISIQARPWLNLIPGAVLKCIWSEPVTDKTAQRR